MNTIQAAQESDLEILKTDPTRLLLNHRRTVRLVVSKYVSTGMFRMCELDDVVQSVFEILLGKIPAMQEQYDGSTLFVTYLSSIVRNACLRIRTLRERKIVTSALDEKIPAEPDPLADRDMINAFVRRFETILTLFQDKRPKILLCLKLYFRMPITESDIRTWYPRCGDRSREELLCKLGGNFEEMENAEIYRVITPFMNKREKKKNSPDALRKFVQLTMKEILELLNGSPPRHSFDEETLRILLENHFFPFLDKT